MMQTIVSKMQYRFPDLKCDLDKAQVDGGSTYLTMTLGAKSLVIQSLKVRGYGLSKLPADALDDKPDEEFHDHHGVIDRATAIFSEKP